MNDYNLYDPTTKPALHAAFASHKEDIDTGGVQTLLYTLRQLDKMAEQFQERFIEDICLKYDDCYIYSRGSMLFPLADAVRNAAIRIEQVPADLRDEVAAMVKESAK